MLKELADYIEKQQQNHGEEFPFYWEDSEEGGLVYQFDLDQIEDLTLLNEEQADAILSNVELLKIFVKAGFNLKGLSQKVVINSILREEGFIDSGFRFTNKIKIFIEEGVDLQIFPPEAVVKILFKCEDQITLKHFLEKGLVIRHLNLRVQDAEKILIYNPTIWQYLFEERDTLRLDFSGINLSELTNEDLYALVAFNNPSYIEYLLEKRDALGELDFSKLDSSKTYKLVKTSDRDKLEFLIKNGVDLSTLGSYYIYALVEASDRDKLEFLIKNGVDLSTLYSYEIYGLVKASDRDKLELLVKNGIDLSKVDLSTLDSSKIYGLVKTSDQDKLEFLIKNGVDLSTLDSYDICNLVEASDQDKLEFLIKNGVDLSKVGLSTLDSYKILELVKASDRDKLEFLIKNGVDLSKVGLSTLDSYKILELVKASDRDKLEFLIKNGVDLSKVDLSKLDSYNICKLVEASDRDKLEFLIKNSVDLSTLDSYKIYGLVKASDKDKLELLVKNGVDLSKVGLNKLDSYDICNLVEASDRDKLEFLIKNGVDLSTLDSYKILALVEASDRDKLEFLIKNGVDLSTLDSYKILALIKDSDRDKLEFLIKNGVDLSKVDLSKLDSYNICKLVEASDRDKFEFLIKNSVDLSTLDSSKIYGLVKASDKDKLELLVKNGVDLSKVDFAADARNGETSFFQNVRKYINIEDIQTDHSRNFFEYTKESCFARPDPLDKITIDEVLYPLNIAQNFCDIMIKQKDSSILVVRGHKVQKVYDYLLNKIDGSLRDKVKTTHEFDIYINPGHGFFSVDGKTKGFYPNDNNDSKEVLANDYTAEHITYGTIGGTVFIFALGIFSLPTLCFAVPKLLPVTVSALLSSVGTYGIYNKFHDTFMPAIDHKIGRMENEDIDKYASETNNNLKVSFILNDNQVKKLVSYISTVQKDCEDNNPDHCMYNFLSRNCMVFLQDAFEAAGLEGHYTDYFTFEQLKQYDVSSFTEGYSTKALIYARFNKALSSVNHVYLSDLPGSNIYIEGDSDL